MFALIDWSALNCGQRNFFLQSATVNTEMHNWSSAKKKTLMLRPEQKNPYQFLLPPRLREYLNELTRDMLTCPSPAQNTVRRNSEVDGVDNTHSPPLTGEPLAAERCWGGESFFLQPLVDSHTSMGSSTPLNIQAALTGFSDYQKERETKNEKYMKSEAGHGRGIREFGGRSRCQYYHILLHICIKFLIIKKNLRN